MPNWCMNQMILSGPKDVLDEIAATGLSLDKIVPCPDDLKGFEKITSIPKNEKKKRAALESKYGVSTEFDWHVTRWGTKWDINVGPISVEKAYGTDLYEINVSFDSAWSPPVKAMEALYEKYKDRGLALWLEYFEPGCAFLGTSTGKDGVFKDDYREYEDADELQRAVEELEHGLAENEVEYLREREAESDSVPVDDPPKDALTKSAVNKSAIKKTTGKSIKKTSTKTSTKKTSTKKTSTKKTSTKKK